MRKLLLPVFSAVLLLALSSCSKEVLFLSLEGTVWNLKVDDITTWVCFHDADSASLLQHNSELGRVQADHGTYTADGHVVTVKTKYASEYTISRTFFNLKRVNKNDNYTRISPYSYKTLAGSIWITPIDNTLHLAYFPSGSECVDISYTNITREETGPAYGWSSSKKTASIKGSSVEVGNLSATTYKGLITSGVYALQSICDPLEEDGASGLKGTVWTYNNTGYPADVPIVYIFNGKDSFIRVSGLWAGTVSESRISPIVFDVVSGTYTESGGTLTITIGETKESCPIVGSSFTLFERTFNKLSY
jgi:hypothetical protein